MKNETRQHTYYRRIQKAIDYICSNLEQPLPVERLAQAAGFSRFHFHRQFTAYTGFTVAQFVRLTRLKRSAYQLAFDPPRRVIDIALDAGFASPEAFTRAFRDAYGQTPSGFRHAPRWDSLRQGADLPTTIRSNGMNPSIVDFPETRVATLEHCGPPATLMSSVGRFIEWRRSCQDSPVATSRTFGVAYNDPDVTPPAQFRFDICGELAGSLEPNGAGIVEKRIPAGRCAVARHVGSTNAIGETVRAMYAKWLPQSGEKLRDFPVFFEYVERMPAVKEHEQITDVYLPLAGSRRL